MLSDQGSGLLDLVACGDKWYDLLETDSELLDKSIIDAEEEE